MRTIKPTVKQKLTWKKLFDRTTKFILFGGGGGSGKSWLICEWLVYMCQTFPDTKWFIGRAELKRLMGSTYVTFLKVCKFHGIPKDLWELNGQYNYIQFKNGSRIDLLDVKYLPSDPLYERFGSLEFTGGALEEAGEIHFSAFDILKSRIGRHNNQQYNIPSKILITCNPKKNWLYQEFYKPWKEKELNSDKAFIQALYYDNPHTITEYEQNLSSITDPILKKRLMHGEWEYDEDPTRLFDYENIINMFTNDFVLKEDEKKFLSVDIARFGEDKTIIVLWKGFYILKIYEYSKQDLETTQKEIEQIAKENSIPRSQIVIDEDGLGGGIVDSLKGVRGFINNSRAFEMKLPHETKYNLKLAKQNFGNLKAQCYYALAEKVRKNEIGIYSKIPVEIKEKLIADLEQIKRKNPDKDGKFYVTPKEEIKKNIGRSPDYGDALMMRMYFEVATPPKLFFFDLKKSRTR